MALSFPMPWAQFAGLFPIQSAPWRLKRFEQVTWPAGGVPSVSDLADPRWTVKVALDYLSSTEATELQALFNLHGSGRPFLMHDPERPGPRLDPLGAALVGATPTVASVGPGRLAITGLPAGYALSRGDLISIDHGGMKRGCYEVGEPVTANSSGVTPQFSLMPAPRVVASVGQAVTLVRPCALMIVLPGTFEPGTTRGGIRSGMTFEAVEAF